MVAVTVFRVKVPTESILMAPPKVFPPVIELKLVPEIVI